MPSQENQNLKHYVIKLKFSKDNFTVLEDAIRTDKYKGILSSDFNLKCSIDEDWLIFFSPKLKTDVIKVKLQKTENEVVLEEAWAYPEYKEYTGEAKYSFWVEMEDVVSNFVQEFVDRVVSTLKPKKTLPVITFKPKSSIKIKVKDYMEIKEYLEKRPWEFMDWIYEFREEYIVLWRAGAFIKLRISEGAKYIKFDEIASNLKANNSIEAREAIEEIAKSHLGKIIKEIAENQKNQKKLEQWQFLITDYGFLIEEYMEFTHFQNSHIILRSEDFYIKILITRHQKYIEVSSLQSRDSWVDLRQLLETISHEKILNEDEFVQSFKDNYEKIKERLV